MSEHRVNLRLPNPGEFVFPKAKSERPSTSQEIIEPAETPSNPFEFTAEELPLKAGSKSLMSSAKLKNSLRLTSEKLKSLTRLSDHTTESTESCLHGPELIKLAKQVKLLEIER
jgi:hypothetical protein